MPRNYYYDDHDYYRCRPCGGCFGRHDFGTQSLQLVAVGFRDRAAPVVVDDQERDALGAGIDDRLAERAGQQGRVSVARKKYGLPCWVSL